MTFHVEKSHFMCRSARSRGGNVGPDLYQITAVSMCGVHTSDDRSVNYNDRGFRAV